jgi:metal-responsive CopG/Arc/MetJ family transcriptional regulator
MANIKTAISLQKSLFEQVETLAHELKVSRSRVFVLALESYLREYQDRLLFEKINKAIEDVPSDKIERKRAQQLRRHHRRMVEGEW